MLNQTRSLTLLSLIGLLIAACSAAGGPTSTPGPLSPEPTLSANSPGTMMSTPNSMMMGTSNSMMTGTPGTMMEGTPIRIPEAEFDQMFIDMMVPHHQGAVEMANLAKQRAEHAELKQLADDMITSQTAEIKQMQTWRQQWYGSSDTPPMTAMPMLSGMPGMSSDHVTMDMTADIEKLRSATEPFDQSFIVLMTAHHQLAIDAAQLALQQAKHAEIKQLAQNIIDAQQREIDQMAQWQQSWYVRSTPPNATATP